MLKHASPNFSPVYAEQMPFSPQLTHISSEERLNLEDYEQSKAFTKAPGFFLRSGGRGRPSSGRIVRRKPEANGSFVDRGSPRPSFSLLEKRMKLVQQHWKRKAWTKSPKQSIDLTEDGESSQKKKEAPTESLEIEGSEEEIRELPDGAPFNDQLGGTMLPSEREESVRKVSFQDAETYSILNPSRKRMAFTVDEFEGVDEFDELMPGSVFFDDIDDSILPFVPERGDNLEVNFHADVYYIGKSHRLEESLSGMPSGIHHVEFNPDMRHRTMSGRDAEILMAGNDECGTTVLVKYADSDALQLRSLKSINRIR